MDVHFIGVGKMGLPMALHLQRAGHAVQVSDVGPAQLAQARHGATNRGLQETLVLGDLYPKRDWGYAGDYVRGMWQMLQHTAPDDFVLATGETHSIEEFLTLAFAEVGVDDWRPFVTQDPAFMRPAEVDILLGNPAKAERVLGWQREVSFPGLVSRMVAHDLALESTQEV